MKVGKAPTDFVRPPLLGDHTDDLPGTLCEVPAAELVRLRRDGVT